MWLLWVGCRRVERVCGIRRGDPLADPQAHPPSSYTDRPCCAPMISALHVADGPAALLFPRPALAVHSMHHRPSQVLGTGWVSVGRPCRSLVWLVMLSTSFPRGDSYLLVNPCPGRSSHTSDTTMTPIVDVDSIFTFSFPFSCSIPLIISASMVSPRAKSNQQRNQPLYPAVLAHKHNHLSTECFPPRNPHPSSTSTAASVIASGNATKGMSMDVM